MALVRDGVGFPVEMCRDQSELECPELQPGDDSGSISRRETLGPVLEPREAVTSREDRAAFRSTGLEREDSSVSRAEDLGFELLEAVGFDFLQAHEIGLERAQALDEELSPLLRVERVGR
jgi:hypothetical protein